MINFIIKRLAYTVLVMLGVSLIVFFIIYLAPGDPVLLILGDNATQEEILAKRIEMGFNQPLWKQYIIYVFGVIKGDLGTSLYYNKPCADIIFPLLKNTIILTFSSMVLSLFIAIPFGIIAAVKRGTITDLGAMTFAMLGQACSPVWLGILLVLVFAVKLGWLPAFGTEGFKALILPSISLGTPLAALTVRLVRSGMIDTLDEDYILAARAKGEPYVTVVTKYALRNVLLPVITVVGMQVGQYLGGAVVTEQIFAWNGVGRLMVTSISRRDYPMVQTCLLLASFLYVMVNLVVDILYMYIDPRLRIRNSGSRKFNLSIINGKNNSNIDKTSFKQGI